MIKDHMWPSLMSVFSTKVRYFQSCDSGVCFYNVPFQGLARIDLHINSTEYLGLIAQNSLGILFERAAPAGRLKQDFISLTTREGKAIKMTAGGGYVVCPVELPREIFDDFAAASFIEQSGPEDAEGRIMFHLTTDGYERGLAGG